MGDVLTTMWTVHEASRLLRCDAKTVRRMIGAGRLPAVRLRRAYRIPDESLRALMTTPEAVGPPADTGDDRGAE